MNRTFTAILSWLLPVILSARLLAQSPPNQPFQCGTEDLTPQQIRALVQQGNLALERKRASGAAFTAITYVPIRPHIFRRSDGSGGFSLASLNQAMALTNSYFLSNGYGIQFYFAGSTPDYINNTAAYENYNNESVDDRDAANALNQYYVYQIASGAGGFATYPANSLATTRSFVATSGSINDLGNRLIPHELGHTFNLIHTYGQNAGTTTELVTRGAGANCATDGDLICDTPADPYNMSGAGTIIIDGCPQYYSPTTTRDANGDAYSPSITNIMSYYYPCTHDFTPGQYDRMQAGLALRQTHTAYSLDAPPTNAAAPSNLRVSATGSLVSLTWQDNATNEMGYFIERSTSPTTGFVPIGGVEPNTMTFVDNRAVTPNHYYYRIRPSNTTTGSLSPTVDITVSGFTTTVTGNYSLLQWPSAGTGATYEVQWRVVGASTWSSYQNLPENRFGLTDLLGNTTYEWRVRTMGSDQYAEPVRFTVPCLVPLYPYSDPAGMSVRLGWQAATGQSYTLRWRAIGNSDWTVVSNISANTYSLPGLQPSTAYEWQVQGGCSPTVSSDFSEIKTFSTLSCQAPSSLQAYELSSSSARLGWSLNYTETGRITELRYRAVDSAEWTVVSSLPTTTYLLNGLASNTQYEWQAKSLCSPTESTDFSVSAFFKTKAPCASMYTLKNGNWPDASLWSCGWVPKTVDSVHLRHTVTIPQNYQATAGTLVYDVPVSLRWLTGSRLLLSQ